MFSVFDGVGDCAEVFCELDNGFGDGPKFVGQVGRRNGAHPCLYRPIAVACQ